MPPSNNENSIIKKHNELIEARYRLSIAEQRLILLLASNIHNDDDDFEDYEIRVSDLASMFGLEKCKAIYKEVEEASRSLLERTIDISRDGKKIYTAWLSYIEYVEGSGIVKIRFDKSLKPYLLQLKSNFTQYKTKYVINFKSQYSIRIYELLKMEAFKAKNGRFEKTFEISKLRLMLGIKKDEYGLFGHLKDRVIEPAQCEITEKTDLNIVETLYIKTGRKVTGVCFVVEIRKEQEKESLIIEQKPLIQEQTQEVDNKPIALDLDKEKEEVYKKLIALSVNRKTAFTLCKTHLLDRLVNNIRYAQSEIEQGKDIANIAGYIVKAINGDFYNQTRLKIEDEKRIKQEKKRKEEEEQRRQDRLKAKRTKLDNEASKQIRDEFLSSLTDKEKEELFIMLRSEYDVKIHTMIKDINSSMLASNINQLIPDFEEKKRRYIENILKTK